MELAHSIEPSLSIPSRLISIIPYRNARRTTLRDRTHPTSQRRPTIRILRDAFRSRGMPWNFHEVPPFWAIDVTVPSPQILDTTTPTGDSCENSRSAARRGFIFSRPRRNGTSLPLGAFPVFGGADHKCKSSIWTKHVPHEHFPSPPEADFVELPESN